MVRNRVKNNFFPMVRNRVKKSWAVWSRMPMNLLDFISLLALTQIKSPAFDCWALIFMGLLLRTWTKSS